MAAIRVRLRSTGQTGTLDDSQFDPNMFERLDMPQQPSALSRLGSGAVNLLSSIFQGPQRLGQGLGGAVRSIWDANILNERQRGDQLLYETLQRQASRTNNPEKLAQLSQQGQNIAQSTANQQGLTGQAQQKAVEDTIKGGVGTAALFAPGAPTGKGRILSSILSGVGSGYGASQTGEGLKSAAGGAVVGGVIGGFGELANKFAQRFLNRGANTTNVTGKTLKSDPFFLKNRDQLRQVAGEIGTSNTNTATQNLSLVEDAFNKSQSQIDDILRNADTIDENVLLDSLDNTLNQSNWNPNSKAQNQRLNNWLQKLSETGGDPVAVNQLKSELRSQLSPAFTKINKGNPLTANEEISMSVYRAIQDSLDNISPEIRQINSFQKSLYDLADEFGGVIKGDKRAQFKLPVGSNVPLPFSQEQARSGIQKTGSTLGNILSAPIRAGSQLTQQPTLRNILTSNAVNQLSQTPNAPQETPLPAGPQVQPGMQTGDVLSQILTPEVLALGVISGEISPTAAKYLQSISGSSGEKQGEIATIENNLNELESQLQGIPAGIPGGLLSLASNVPGAAPNAKVFNATRQAFTGPIARVISQEVGVLTDRDVKRAQDILPGISDTPQERADKIAVLRRAIDNLKQGKAYSPEGQAYLNQGGGSLESLFTQ